MLCKTLITVDCYTTIKNPSLDLSLCFPSKEQGLHPLKVKKKTRCLVMVIVLFLKNCHSDKTCRRRYPQPVVMVEMTMHCSRPNHLYVDQHRVMMVRQVNGGRLNLYSEYKLEYNRVSGYFNLYSGKSTLIVLFSK